MCGVKFRGNLLLLTPAPDLGGVKKEEDAVVAGASNCIHSLSGAKELGALELEIVGVSTYSSS